MEREMSIEFIDKELTKTIEDLREADNGLLEAILVLGFEEEDLDKQVNIENLLNMLNDFVMHGGRAYFRGGGISANNRIRSLLAKYQVGNGIKHLSTQAYKKLIDTIIEYKENTDCSKYRKVVNVLDMENEGIVFNGDEIIVYHKVKVGEVSEVIKDAFSKLSEKVINGARQVYMEEGLGQYTKLIVMLSLIAAFDEDIPNKMRLLHLVAGSDSGKTHFYEILERYIPIHKVQLADIFADRTKVDTEALAKSLIWFQEEHTVLRHEYKELTGMISVNKAYSANAIHLRPPLVLMVSAEDIQQVISEQFQNRLLKVKADVENIKEKWDGSMMDLNVVSHMLTHDAVLETLTEYKVMNLREKAIYLEEVEQKYRVQGHSIEDSVKTMITDILDEIKNDISSFSADRIIRDHLIVKKSKFKKFIDAVIEKSTDPITGKNLKFEALSKNAEDFGFHELCTKWGGENVKGYALKLTPSESEVERELGIVTPANNSRLVPPPAPRIA